MAGISSPIPEIDRIFFRATRTAQAIQVKQAVRLKDDYGWLLEDDKGRIHAVGRVHDRLIANAYIVGVTAREGSLWGRVLEGLVALKKVSKGQLEEHRRVMAERVGEMEKRGDLMRAKELCAKHGWTLDAGEAEDVTKAAAAGDLGAALSAEGAA